MESSMERRRKRVFDTIQIGHRTDWVSRAFDYFIVIVIAVNLFVTLFSTFDESEPYAGIIDIIEGVTIAIFTIEYALRLWTARYLYPDKKPVPAAIKFFFSFYGIIDFLTFFPYFLPIVFPAGVVAFRIFRVIRIFRLFRINSQYDAFNVITAVLTEKKNQLLSSMSLILILMVASSLCMYSLEHEAQPEAFKNAFSGIWWSTSTLLTVGYGDIYPITLLGKAMGIVISFLGVGMVAIPTGIISAGFVEQYTRFKSLATTEEHPLRFVTANVYSTHPWCGKKLKDIVFPPQLLLLVILRKENEIAPGPEVTLQADDKLIIAAKRATTESSDLDLREVRIKDNHPWVGHELRELDISRQELVLTIQRKGKLQIPNGSSVIKNGDILVIYKRKSQ